MGTSSASRDFGTAGEFIDTSSGYNFSSSAGTLLFWQFADATTTTMQAGGQSNGHFCRVLSSNTLSTFLSGSFITSSSTISDTTWTHFGYKWDAGSSANLTFYFQGATDGTSSSWSPQSSTAAYRLGANGASGIQNYNGQLCYFGVWSTDLTTDQVNEAMWRPFAVPGNLEFSMPLWGESTEVDRSGNGRDGTLTGTALSTNGPAIWF